MDIVFKYTVYTGPAGAEVAITIEAASYHPLARLFYKGRQLLHPEEKELDGSVHSVAAWRPFTELQIGMNDWVLRMPQ